MKKVFMMTLIIIFATSVFAQEVLQIESCSLRTEKQVLSPIKYYSTILLSNGDKLCHEGSWGWRIYPGPNSRPSRMMIEISCNLDCRKSYPKGTLVYKYATGDRFELVNMTKTGTYTIKKVSIREINVELNANFDYGYRTFLGGKAHLYAKGGVKTVVNIIFTNGKTASIIAADDPIWLEASAGQKVDHYQVRDCNIYNLLF